VLRTKQAERSSTPGIRSRLVSILTDPVAWYWAAVVLTTGLFFHSLFAGGHVWDEREEFVKLKSQLAFAKDFLSGRPGLSFRSLHGDYAFYGIGAVVVPYVLSFLVEIVWLRQPVHSYEHSYSAFLHSLTFLCAIVTVAYVRRFVTLVTGNRDVGALAGLTLLLTPFWIGYGFIDYKDIPVATGVIAATYYAAAYCKEGLSRTSLCFFLSLFFIGIQKLAAVPLALPACIVIAIAALQQPSARRFSILASQAAASLFLLYLATPPAWPEPVQFATASLIYSSQHDWAGCTLTAGRCIGREVANGDGYSAFRYLGLWYAVKLPVMILVGLFTAIFLYLWSFRQLRIEHHLLVAAICWPIAAIGIRNSTLYDGIRHVLFLVPLAVATIFVLVPATIWLRLRWALAFYFLFLVVESLKLQPYQYVWFNEAARFVATEKNFETDYWGYSLREAVSLARGSRRAADWIVSQPGGNPNHLVEILVSDRFASNVGSVPLGATYFVVGVTRMNKQPPPQCDGVEYVTRSQLLAPAPLRLSFVARCQRTAP
jgi:hypothetical protein